MNSIGITNSYPIAIFIILSLLFVNISFGAESEDKSIEFTIMKHLPALIAVVLIVLSMLTKKKRIKMPDKDENSENNTIEQTSYEKKYEPIEPK